MYRHIAFFSWPSLKSLKDAVYVAPGECGPCCWRIEFIFTFRDLAFSLKWLENRPSVAGQILWQSSNQQMVLKIISIPVYEKTHHKIMFVNPSLVVLHHFHQSLGEGVYLYDTAGKKYLDWTSEAVPWLLKSASFLQSLVDYNEMVSTHHGVQSMGCILFFICECIDFTLQGKSGLANGKNLFAGCRCGNLMLQGPRPTWSQLRSKILKKLLFCFAQLQLVLEGAQFRPRFVWTWATQFLMLTLGLM